MSNIGFTAIEKKWRAVWEKKKVFEAKEGKRKKFYVLEMFPYPSGSGLHMGHAFNYVIGDIYSRFKRMNGFEILHPMGYDSFGLPAENAAIKAGKHPRKFTESAIKNFIKQQKELGLSYDWTRVLMTHSPDYYKWNQYLFLKFLENGLVYRKKAPVNWCRKCGSVLANEQVHNGKCWRHSDVEVEIKQLEQWFIKTTKYAEELLDFIDKLDWPERIKAMQKNWIGRSEGSEIDFSINNKKWEVFTTRADTLFGVKFLVVSAQHSRLMEIISESERKKVVEFLKKIRSTKKEDMDRLEKEGVFTGSYAVHPLTKEKIPVWVGNFVVAEYGSGMVMGVPAHDQRDFEFARKYEIDIRKVISEKGIEESEKMESAFVEDGVLINSGVFNGLRSEEARKKITDELEKNNLGRKSVQFKLRDWLVSRQRYWGTPIPVVYCDKCGIVPVQEKELPVKLPEKVKFGRGNPLEKNKKFVKVNCSKCGGNATRETDTMDTFFDSSWYYLRFCDANNKKKVFESNKVKYWAPVDKYIGGAEHACMHLIYARFFSKALRDLGFVKFDEPFKSLFNQGMIHGNDGFVMAKSRGNVVDPLGMIKKYGADALRLFLVSVASPDKDFVWSDNSMESTGKFVRSVYEYCRNVKIGKTSKRIESKLNKAIKEIGGDFESMKYNLAVIKLRKLFESFEREISKDDLEKFISVLSVFCPYVAEELWSKIGKGLVFEQEWPKYNEKKIDEKFEKIEEAIDRVVFDVMNILGIMREKGKEGKKIYLYTIPNELEFYNSNILKKRIGKEVEVFAVNDAKKYDPEGKARKAKPGKPAIFIE